MSGCRRAVCAGSVLTLLAGWAGDASAQWPQFRGPNGSGVDSAVGSPVSFSPTSNMVWRTTVPFGQSSPLVVGRRVYLTARDGDRLLTLCLDVETGRETWRREIRRERSQQAYRANDPASPTPAADEHGVVVFFADFGLAAYPRGAGRLPGVARCRRRQGVPRERGRKDDRPQGRGTVGDPRRQRSRRRDPRDAGAQRRANLRTTAKAIYCFGAN